MHLIGQRKNSGILIGQRKQHASVDGRPDRFNGSVKNASDWSADKARDWLGRKSWGHNVSPVVYRASLPLEN
jgi:hypothetical protein